jgi:thiol-disulfide isomerase/thioredoxin
MLTSSLKTFQRQPFFIKCLILLFVFGLVIFFLSEYRNASYTPHNSEGFKLTPAKVHYYYMDGCGHCKDFSPVWDEFTQSYKGNVQFQKINMKDAEEDLKKYKVEGFPTVVVIDSNGEFEHYNGERTVAGLQSYFE